MLNLFTAAIVIHLFCIFFLSAVLKMIYFRASIQMVIEYDIFPEAYSRVWGSMLPFIEFMAALMLLHESTMRYGAFVQFLLLLSFAFAVILVLKSNRKLMCGCYGKLLDTEVDAFTLGKIFFLLILSIYMLIAGSSVTIEYSFYSVGLGIYMTALLLVTQKVWGTHQESMRLLKKNQVKGE